MLSGILDIGPRLSSLGLWPSRSPTSSATSFGPEPGGSAPVEARKYNPAIIRNGNIAAVKALAGSPAFLPPKNPPTAAVIEPGIVNIPKTIIITKMYMKPANIPSLNRLIDARSGRNDSGGSS
ncbi:uncharacterized protein METZ01_LOCUS82240 [marine metagenome]|uniref:Uncharacterized protein n=1 Tax=marine metagenome TaxID=408172 RepID=A0A381UMK5_9ZZZZ